MKNSATRHNYDKSRLEKKKRQTPNLTNGGSRKKYVHTLLYILILIICSLSSITQKNIFAQNNTTNILIDGKIIMTLRFSEDIDNDEQRVVEDAAKYWASILKSTGVPDDDLTGDKAAVFDVIKADLENNAAAVSLVDTKSSIDNKYVTGVQSILADGYYVNGRRIGDDEDPTFRAHAQILIGTGWETTMEKSQSGAINNNLLPVIIHEMGHVLGMTTSMAEGTSGGEPNGKWQFGKLTRWDSWLRDNNGNAPSNTRRSIGYGNKLFDLGDPDQAKNPSAPTFRGENAMKVFYDGNDTLNNAGIPVTGYVTTLDEEGNAQWGIDGGGTLSHVDTCNSLLSWQNFRTYQGLIEVEMAVFQDLGYQNIQTRDFFGQSFYVDGEGRHGEQSQLQIANRGFGTWNATTTSYDTSNANTGMFGIGVHLFGSKLNILQQGTINAAGEGSAGIRVDGVGNFLTIAPTSKIQMGEDNGIGLLVAYGKEHIIVHRGLISAYAERYEDTSQVSPITNGIAASFDFGLQLFLNGDEDDSIYLQSYYVDPSGKKLSDTDGPLVRRFDVTGQLHGSYASIFISETAHVSQINLMSGGGEFAISGNIISEYSINNRSTSLTFGLLPDGNGQAQELPDNNFKLVLSDHINYDRNIDPTLLTPTDGLFDIGIFGGTTNFNSIRVSAQKLNIGKDGTLLLGKSSTSALPVADMQYTRISSIKTISNDGVLAGMGEIRVGEWDLGDYDYTRQPSGVGTGTGTGTGTDIFIPAGWSNAKVAFWEYNITQGAKEYEQYFKATNWFTNQGTISPGIIPNGESNNVGQYSVGQIDIHGSLMLTKDSVYDFTINGIPGNRSVGEWGVDSDAIWVSGTTMLGGKLRVFLTQNFQDELRDLLATSGDDPITYQLIRSASFSSSPASKFSELEFGGNFSDVKISAVYVNPYDPTVAQVTFFPNSHFFESRGSTWNTRSVGRAIDNATWEVPELAFALLGAKDDPATMNNVLHQIATDIRANSIMSGVLNPSRVLFPRIGWGNGQMDSGERGRINWEINRERTIMNQFSQFNQSRGQAPQRLRNGSIWFDYIGQSISSPSDGNSSKYNTYVNGGIIGGEWNITQHSSIGLVAGYGNGATKSERNKVRVNDYFGGLYFVATPFNQYEFKAYIGLGRQEYSLYHTIYNNTLKDSDTGEIVGIFDNYFGRTDGTTINTSYELTRPIMITERFILRPTVGVDSQYAWQSGFTEEALSTTSNGLYALTFDSMYLNHNMVRLGINSESIGPRGSLWLRGFYNFNFGGHSYPTSRVSFAKGGGKFDIRGADIGWDAINLGVGFHLWLNADHSASFITDFNTDLFIGNSGASSFGIRLGIVQNF